MWKIKLTNKAKKQIDSCEKDLQNNINTAIANMISYFEKGTGTKPDIKKLKGKYKGYLRLRVGNYRVIFTINYIKPEVFILHIISRDKAYK